MFSQTRASLFLVGIIAFFAMNFFCVFNVGMPQSMDGKMAGCTSMPGTSVCSMSPIEHAVYMQGLLVNIPQHQDPILAFLLALTFISTAGLIWFQGLLSPPDINLRKLQYFYRQKSFSILRLLQELLSQGLLNPKPF